MFTLIGFGLFMLPIMGVVVYGIARLIETVGKMATIILAVSLPFYFVTIRTLFRALEQDIIDIANHVDTAGNWNFSEFEWMSIGGFVVLLIFFHLVSKTHMKKNNKKQ